MKQYHRHTKPIRGKDPTFKKEGLEIWSGLNLDDTNDIINAIQYRQYKKQKKAKKTFDKI